MGAREFLGGLFARPAVADAGAASRPAPAARASGQRTAAATRSSHAAQAKPTQQAAKRRRVIEGTDGVPKYQGLLSVGARALVQLPKGAQDSLVVLDLGQMRAALLYDVEFGEKDLYISMARGRIISGNMTLHDDDVYATSAEIIARLVKAYVAQHGVSERVAFEGKSQAQERFTRWQEVAVREGATDLHIQVVGHQRAEVMIRVHGTLEPLPDPSGVCTDLEAIEAMAWPFNSDSIAGSNSASQWDAGKDAYCMTKPMLVGNRKITLRYQALRGHKGPKVVARLLDVDSDAPTRTYEDLGYERSHERQFLEAATAGNGIFLLAGTTGSGKTTTIKTFLETHPDNGSKAMYSVEDPVEYPMKNLHQISFQRDLADPEESARKFSETVSSLLRGDLDLAFIGEVRDWASANAAQMLQESGHMAIGTVHAHFLSGIFPRVSNVKIGLSRDVLTNPKVIALLGYQALVPVLCGCAVKADEALSMARETDERRGGQPYDLPRLESLLRGAQERLQVDPDRFRYRNIAGCPHCRGRGVVTQTVVAEMLVPDRKWLDLARAGDDHLAANHYRSTSDGRLDSTDMTGKTVFEHAVFKALRGQIDPRQCEQFELFSRYEHAGRVA